MEHRPNPSHEKFGRRGDPRAELPKGAKCTRCRGQAYVRMPAHNANFCWDCFLGYFRTGVARAMKKFALPDGATLMVAVSGGKDSLAAWSVLTELGYKTRGLHVDLGIEGFSGPSSEAVARFAGERGLEWVQYPLKDIFGYRIPEILGRTRRKICSICGFLKRQILNRLVVKEGLRHLVVGHNLDDEAGRMLGNMMRHRTQYFEKQYPVLPSSHPGMPTKLKPLYRLEAWEIRAYCKILGIEPLSAACPLSRGATSHAFKEALDLMEAKMPGTKRDFLFTYLDHRSPPVEAVDWNHCRKCGQPAYGEQCSVCNLLDRLEPDAEAPL